MEMIELAFNDWTDEDFFHARRHNSFNARMLGGSPGRPVNKDTPMSKWEISLRNWGHDPRKPNSPGHQKVKDWLKAHFEDMESDNEEVEDEEMEEDSESEEDSPPIKKKSSFNPDLVQLFRDIFKDSVPKLRNRGR
jgi:hypothetical protein